MNYEMNLSTLFLIFLITLIFIVVFFIFQKKQLDKITITFFSFSFFIYSGYGISNHLVSNWYISSYAIFLLAILLSYTFAKRPKKNKNQLEIAEDPISNFFEINKNFLYFLVFVYFICLFVPLFVPIIRIKDFFSPPISLINDIFSKRDELKDTPLLYLTQNIKLMLTPFFLIYLKLLKDKSKYFLILFLSSLWIYLEFLKVNYISRNDMVGYAMLLFFIVFSSKGKEFFIRKKYFIILCIFFIVSIPFLISYQYTRSGATVGSNTGLLESVKSLLNYETYYPIYFQQIIDKQISVSPIIYFLWLLFIIVPSQLVPMKPTIAINGIFTTAITGLIPGQRYYSIILPSILGEAFMLYGNLFFWIHAIFLGTMLGKIQKYFEQYPSLMYWNIFILVQFIKITRGGSQGFISEIINGSILIFCLILFLKNKINKERKLI
ncbi:O-antigen polymerase [Carnobacterium maltaromaticum]|uniref:O-antigen polymerase n=1 Tax=Carnobacterium maltaromaticum TaxID=2751 RepID=UPI0039B0291D